MYTRTIIYRVYSILTLILGIFGFIPSIIFAFTDLEFSGIFSPLQLYFIAIKIGLVIFSFVSFLFSYMEFSSMYVFADMIQYEESGTNLPMIKKSFIFPPKIYNLFGAFVFIIYIINTVCVAVACLIIIINQIATGRFNWLPVIPLVLEIGLIVICYINYYIRYKSISILLEITTSKEITEPLKQRLAKLNSKWLRGYCIFLFVVCVVLSVIFLLILFAVFGSISAIIGLPFTIGVTVVSILFFSVYIIYIGIFGCYVDNIAKMVEHYQIKFGLISNRR